MRFWLSGIAVVLCALSALGVERRVPLEYRTIQAAIDASRTGDVVRIANGIYREDIVIDHKAEVTLRGDVPRALSADVPCWEPVAEANGCVVLGTIQILSCFRLAVEGLTVISPGPAIYVDGSKACFASDIAIRYCNLISARGAAIGLGAHYRHLSVSCTNTRLGDGVSQFIESSGAPYLADVLVTCSRSTYVPGTVELLETSLADVVVAVIDSGVDRAIPAIACRMWRNPLEIPDNGLDDDANGYVDDVFGWDFRDGDPDSLVGSSLHWHGTFVAGVLVDAVESRLPTDVPCTVRVMDLRLLDSEGVFYTSDWPRLVEAIEYAVDQGARIINLSLYAMRTPPTAVHEAVQRAVDRGVLVVAIAGNGAEELGPIARWSEVLSVGAVNAQGELATFSNVGEELDLVSRGVDVLSLVPGGALRTGSGTSFAAPRVAGLAAFHIASDPSLTVTELVDVLRGEAIDLGAPGHDPYTGWGLIP